MTISADLFSYLPGIEVTSDDVLKAEMATYQILQAKFPDMDLREGTGVRDLVLRPASTLLAMVNKAILLYFQNNTLDSVTDSSPSDFVDSLLSNWFMDRITGNKSVVNIRLYFSKSKNVTVTSDSFFSVNGTEKYYPDTTYFIPATGLVYDSGSNQYYTDIDVTAELVGTEYDVTAGSMIYFSNFDPYLLHVEINYLKTSASNAETNTEFLSRAKGAISTRNLINIPSISSNLLSEFSTLDGVYSAGFGSQEMVRDFVKVFPVNSTTPYLIHRGGCIDVYCRTKLISSVTQFTTDSQGRLYLTGPIYKISRVNASNDTMPSGASFIVSGPSTVSNTITGMSISGGTTLTCTIPDHGLSVGQRVKISGTSSSIINGPHQVSIVDKNTITITIPAGSYPSLTTATATYISPDQDLGFSTNQQIVVDFGTGQPGKTVSFTCYYFSDIDGVQNYLSSADNRVLCADILAKGFNICLLDIGLTSYTGLAPDASVATTTIEKYLLSLNSGQPFIMSDMVSLLDSAGIESLQTPVTVNYTKYWRDWLGNTYGSISDVMDPSDSLNVFMLNTLTTSGTLV